MRHLLADGDGRIIWEGDPSHADGYDALRRLLYEMRNNARSRERRAERIALGLCVECGLCGPMNTATRCERCAKDHAEGQRLRSGARGA